jgi:hypothetical protein
LIIAPDDKSKAIQETLAKRFNAEVGTHYDFKDRQAGALLVNNQRYPFMSLAIGVVSSEGQDFSDIREITETAAEARRQVTLGA